MVLGMEGSGGAGGDLILVGMLEMLGCGFPMACEILPTCWKLSRGSQGNQSVGKLCLLLLKTWLAKHWQPCSLCFSFIMAFCYKSCARNGEDVWEFLWRMV